MRCISAHRHREKKLSEVHFFFEMKGFFFCLFSLCIFLHSCDAEREPTPVTNNHHYSCKAMLEFFKLHPHRWQDGEGVNAKFMFRMTLSFLVGRWIFIFAVYHLNIIFNLLYITFNIFKHSCLDFPSQMWDTFFVNLTHFWFFVLSCSCCLVFRIWNLTPTKLVSKSFKHIACAPPCPWEYQEFWEYHLHQSCLYTTPNNYSL